MSSTKASVNHEKIAEGLSRALQEITEAVEACAKDFSIYPTQAMRHSIADLYSHIFFFLRNAIDWYMKNSFKRALASFSEDFYQRFEDEISNIKRISSNMNRKADHGARAETRYTRLFMEDFQEDTFNRFENMEREAAQVKTAIGQIFRYEEESLKKLTNLHMLIGKSEKRLLLEEAFKYDPWRLEGTEWDQMATQDNLSLHVQ